MPWTNHTWSIKIISLVKGTHEGNEKRKDEGIEEWKDEEIKKDETDDGGLEKL